MRFAERKCLGKAYRRATTVSDDTIGITPDELLHDLLGDLYWRMHDGIRLEVDTEVAEDAHKTRPGSRCMIRVGKNESPLATQRDQLVGHLRNGAESEKDASRQCRILKKLRCRFR